MSPRNGQQSASGAAAQASSTSRRSNTYIRPKYLTTACARCKRLKHRCDASNGFPCLSCINAGLQDICQTPSRVARSPRFTSPSPPVGSEAKVNGCEECRQLGLPCESLPILCDNCVQRGRAANCFRNGAISIKDFHIEGFPENGPTNDLFLDFDPVSSEIDLKLQSIELDYTPTRLASSGSAPTSITHDNNAQDETKDYFRLHIFVGHSILSVFEFLQLASMIFLPTYYASQATPLLECAAKSNEDYFTWTAACEASQASSTPCYGLSPSHIDIERRFCRLPELPVMGIRSDVVESQPTVATPEIEPRQPPPMPISVEKLHVTWIEYLESRKVEWNVLMSIALLFIATSPTIFQIPAASSDPVIRTFAFLAICRAITGVLVGPIFSLHFRTYHATSVHYAHFWVQQTQCIQSPTLWSPWILIALPASSTAWSLILFVCAIFAFLWRADASDDGALMSRMNHMASTLGLRTAITIIFITDLIYIAWTLWTLQKYKHACLTKKSTTGT